MDGSRRHSTCFRGLWSAVVGYCGVVILTGYRNDLHASMFEGKSTKRDLALLTLYRRRCER